MRSIKLDKRNKRYKRYERNKRYKRNERNKRNKSYNPNIVEMLQAELFSDTLGIFYK